MADDSIYYELLGIERSAGEEEIKQAYRKFVFLYHPDRHPGNEEALKQYRLIAKAYEYVTSAPKHSVRESKTGGVAARQDRRRRPTASRAARDVQS